MYQEQFQLSYTLKAKSVALTSLWGSLDHTYELNERGSVMRNRSPVFHIFLNLHCNVK